MTAAAPLGCCPRARPLSKPCSIPPLLARPLALDAISQDLVQPSLLSSISTRISSGTAIVGCVSLSWNATFSGNRSQLSPGCASLKRRTTSCFQGRQGLWAAVSLMIS